MFELYSSCKIKANDIISRSETPGSEILKVTVNKLFFVFLEKKPDFWENMQPTVFASYRKSYYKWKGLENHNHFLFLP